MKLISRGFIVRFYFLYVNVTVIKLLSYYCLQVYANYLKIQMYALDFLGGYFVLHTMKHRGNTIGVTFTVNGVIHIQCMQKTYCRPSPSTAVSSLSTANYSCNIYQYMYVLVESHDSWWTAILGIINSVDCTGRDFCIAPVWITL